MSTTRPTVLSLVVALGPLALTSCRTPKPGHNPPGPVPAAPASVASGSPTPPLESSTPAPRPPPLPEGCFAEVNLQHAPGQLLAQVTRDCQLGSELVVLEPSSLRLAAGGNAELPVTLDSPGCVRWVAVGVPGIEELELTLRDGSANELGTDLLVGNLALLEQEGPVCLEAGPYTLDVRVVRGAGDVWVRGFRTGAPNPAEARAGAR